MVTVDLTHQVLAVPEVQSRILQTDPRDVPGSDSKPTVLRQMLHDLLLYFANTYDRVFGIDAGPPLHDPLAVAVLLSNINSNLKNPLLRFDDKDGERFLVDVVTDGTHGTDPVLTGQVGRTLVKPVADTKAGGVAIPRGVDVDTFWKMIIDVLRRADAWNVSQGMKN